MIEPFNPYMTITPATFRQAVYFALALSVLGLVLVCLPMLGTSRTLEWAAAFSVQICSGYVAMILVIELAGVPLRSFLTQFWAGALFALSLFIVGALAGSASSMILAKEFDPYSYVFKPMFFLSIYGFFPAIIVGLIGSGTLRSLSKDEV